MRRAPLSTTTPRGLSLVAVIVTSNRFASYAVDGFLVVSRVAAAAAPPAPPLAPPVALALAVVLCLFALAVVETYRSLDRFQPARPGRAPPVSIPV